MRLDRPAYWAFAAAGIFLIACVGQEIVRPKPTITRIESPTSKAALTVLPTPVGTLRSVPSLVPAPTAAPTPTPAASPAAPSSPIPTPTATPVSTLIPTSTPAPTPEPTPQAYAYAYVNSNSKPDANYSPNAHRATNGSPKPNGYISATSHAYQRHRPGSTSNCGWRDGDLCTDLWHSGRKPHRNP